jgi:biopolymer transport protein ExbB
MMKLLFILQSGVTEATAQPLAQGAGQLRMPLIEMAIKGGWMMIPIVILSFIAVYIFFERLFAIKKATQVDPNFMDRIRDYIHEGKVDASLKLCQNADKPVARMIEKGISRLGRPLSDVNTAIENVGNLEIAKLEKGLYLLATSAGAAPMIVFLGTVTGMVRAFYDMANAGNNIDIQLLSSGIYQAMVTTVAGLIVGIIAYLCYNVLVARIRNVVNQLESSTMEFMDLLHEPAKA